MDYRMARPTKIDLDRVLRLFAGLAEGDSIATAARAAGLGPATVYRWRARGRAGDPRFVAVARVFEAAEGARRNEVIARFATLPLVRALTRLGL